ncbi:DUF5365 family protein [Bacillus gobiensis]|uniref:DUF5365 family protein n=1 Tax=Bacillus gobiensis TaxID=1441095 RepID=UPI003D1FF2B4
MKVVIAATEEQQKYIEEMISKFYSHIFTRSYTANEIAAFKKQGVLNLSESQYNGTMDEALQIISCLQTIYILLEENCDPQNSNELDLHRLEWNFNKLRSFGLQFPYSSESIHSGKQHIH